MMPVLPVWKKGEATLVAAVRAPGCVLPGVQNCFLIQVTPSWASVLDAVAVNFPSPSSSR
jgi:hypothetical protein